MISLDGWIEVMGAEGWIQFAHAGSIIQPDRDLAALLFGLTNHAGYVPLLRRAKEQDRLSEQTRAELAACGSEEVFVARMDELGGVDWSELTGVHDQRISEFRIAPDGARVFITKWLAKDGCDHIRARLDQDPSLTLREGDAEFQRLVLSRADALPGTRFDLVLRVMKLLADEVGPEAVQLVLWL